MAENKPNIVDYDSFGNGVFIDKTGARPLSDMDKVTIHPASAEVHITWSRLPKSQKFIIGMAFGAVLGGTLYHALGLHDQQPAKQEITDEEISAEHS